MANIVVTSTTNTIAVDFGVYAGVQGLPTKKTYKKSEVLSVSQASDQVNVYSIGDPQWNLAYTATTNCFIVDTVAGVAPTSNADLYDKIIALIA